MDQAFIELCRQTGAERLEMAAKATSREDWMAVASNSVPFAFRWGECWKTNITYQVSDLAAELGFYLEVLGMSVLSIDENCAMLSTEDGYCISLVPASDGVGALPDSIAFEFMIEDILATSEELKTRGASFETAPHPDGGEDSPIYVGVLRTPHGIAIRLWGMIEAA